MDDLGIAEHIPPPVWAGILGAIVALRWVPGKTWVDRAWNLVSSVAIVWFATPAAIEKFEISSQAMAGCLSFFIGVFGLNIASAVTAAIREAKLGEAITDLIRNLRG